MIKKKLYNISLVIIILLLITACRKDLDFTKKSVSLKFSSDSILFDTMISIFKPSTPRSIVFQLKVTNPDDNAIKTNIKLAGNTTSSVFKLNVDGQPGKVFKDIEIMGKDSIFIFVQVFPDSVTQFNNNLPYPIADNILFETNGNNQSVVLFGYGQNVHFINDSVLGTGNIFWPADKPYVIYNSALVPSGSTLTLAAGAQVYSHINSTLFVQGTLVVNGTTDMPTVFQGDRLENNYRDVSGQWNGIHFLTTSKDNVIKNAIIKNAYIGIRLDSLSSSSNPKLSIEQSIIKNNSAVGILAYTSTVKATNNLIYNCGIYTFAADFGGDYQLFHNTFAALGATAGRKDPSVVISNSPIRDSLKNIVFAFPLTYNLSNNIVYGSLDDEIVFNEDPEGKKVTSKTIKNNFLKTTQANLNNNGNIVTGDPFFVDNFNNNYEVTGSSPCKQAGILLSPAVFKDLKGKSRNTLKPTIGAYEAP